MNQKDFFKTQLLKTIHQLVDTSLMTENLKFVIIPCDADNETPRNTWDEIINWWVLPTTTEIKLNLKQVVETLSSRQGLMPLWINVKLQDNDIFILNISRRFRKLKEVREYHKGNDILPFYCKDSSNLVFTNQIERLGLIRKLLWNFYLDTSEKVLFDKQPLKFSEIKMLLEAHFKSYVYFPPNYNHRKIGDKNYSNLTIKKESDINFSIIDNIGTDLEKSILTTSNFDEVLNSFLQKEKGFIIDNLKIEK